MKKVVLLFLILVLSLTVVSCGDDENAPEIANGVDGKSAYELAVEKGYEGTAEEWLASLVGEVGAPGKDGANGQSAYELAVKNGYTGSETEWVASLVGADGKDGINGSNGADGTNGKSAYELACENGFDGSLSEWLDSLVGKDGVDGNNGKDGINGKSAYDIAKENGFDGSVTEWLASLVGAEGKDGTNGSNGINGANGKSAYEIAVDNGYKGSATEWLASLVGEAGAKGADGTNGSNGKSAYELAIANGYQGTEQEWLESLVGANGSNGVNGKSAYELAVENGYEGNVQTWLASLVGAKGEDGANGINGQSAYELAVELGYKGAEAEWIASLAGKNGINGTDGKSAYELACENGFEGSLAEWLDSLVGKDGVNGINGTDGKSAYELAVENGFKGSVTEWLASLVGAKGDKGDDGITPELRIGEDNYWYVSYDNGATWMSLNVKATGPQGVQGEQGDEGLSAYEIYKKYYPEYTGTEKQWISDFISGKLETEIRHTVSFDAGNGTTILDQIIMEGRKATMPEIPVKEGYEFLGWYLGNEQWSFIGFAVTDDITLVAKWREVGTLGLEFYPLPDGTYGVMAGNTQYLDAIVIPSTYNGIAVTQILPNAFKDAVNLETITIPSSITTIGDGAFDGCSIKTAIIPSIAVKYIPQNNLTKVVLINGEAIEDNAFRNCTTLAEIVIPGSVTKIGENAFYGCTSLKEIEIGENITTIGTYAFYNCTSLEVINYNAQNASDLAENNYVFYQAGTNANGIELVIGESVERIPANLFCPINESAEYAPKITSIIFDDDSSCTSIGKSAFYKCESLTGVYVSNIEIWLSINFEGNSAANPLMYAGNLYINNELLTELVIPSNIEIIKFAAFYNCTSIRSVVIQNGTTEIKKVAFAGCTNLESVYIPKSVILLHSSIFKGCSNLNNVVFEEGSSITEIPESTFEGCVALTAINIPSTISIIGNNAFASSGLATIDMLNVESIGQYAFYKCSNLTELAIPESCKFIGKYAFYGASLTSVVFEECEGWSISDSNAAFYATSGIGDSIARSLIENQLNQTLGFSGTSVQLGTTYVYQFYSYNSKLVSSEDGTLNATALSKEMIIETAYSQLHVTENYHKYKIRANYYSCDWVRA